MADCNRMPNDTSWQQCVTDNEVTEAKKKSESIFQQASLCDTFLWIYK